MGGSPKIIVHFMENPKQKWMIWVYPYFSIVCQQIIGFISFDDLLGCFTIGRYLPVLLILLHNFGVKYVQTHVCLQMICSIFV